MLSRYQHEPTISQLWVQSRPRQSGRREAPGEDTVSLPVIPVLRQAQDRPGFARAGIQILNAAASGGNYFWRAGFRPRTTSPFSLLVQRKWAKRKDTPRRRPCGYPARFPRSGLRRRCIPAPLRRLAIHGFARCAAQPSLSPALGSVQGGCKKARTNVTSQINLA